MRNKLWQYHTTCGTLMKKFIEAISVKAYADEEPSGDEEDNNDVDDKSSKSPVINYEELIAKARREEKEKQYKTIEKLKGQIDTLTEQHNNDLLVKADLEKKIAEAQDKLTKVGTGDSEEIKTLKAEIETLNKDKADLEKKVSEYTSAKPVSREDVEAEVRAELEAEYEVKTYKAEKLAEMKDQILVPELVFGSTKEEIDASLQSALDRSNEIRKNLGISDDGKKQKRTPKTPSNPSVSRVQDSQVSLEQLATMDVSSKEYAELRKQLGLH